MKTTDYVNCLSDTELRNFVKNPLTSENAEVASHIYTCDSCAARLLTELGIQAEEALSPDEEEIEVEPVDFKEFWRLRKQKDLWMEVSDLIEQGQARRQNSNHGFVWNPGLAILPNVAATRMGAGEQKEERAPRLSALPKTNAKPAVPSNRAQADQVVLAFISRCDLSAPLFWQALLTIPLTADMDEYLTIVVTDNAGKRIPMGQIVFLGQELPVTDGRAQITLRDFQKGLKNPSVAFRFISGETVEGEFSILKQGELI